MRAMNFIGALTQYDACYDNINNPSGALYCRNYLVDNSPSEGWMQLSNALNSDPLTNQLLEYTTDMSWKTQ